MTRNKILCRAFIVLFCALVFFFALHAKIAVYNGGVAAKATPSTSAKLWTSSQKMEVPPLAYSTVTLFGCLFFALFGLNLRREPQLHGALSTPAPRNLRLRHLHRFLRPPPIQS